ncbi:chemotaxis protein CheR [Nibricoccus aquaticus]|uniref:Chemotaxis protein CheR n=1 Tax=Nibricoccus aquaticus TaxID=2576891 RepID=A0A290QIT3_9BACT|nr:chemotaxis protein CheR [Nibricoccus aquaticus]
MPGDEEKEFDDLRLLLDTVHQRSGLDFREYAFSSLRRRVARAVRETGTENVSGLHLRLKSDGQALDYLIRQLTVHTTAMFRDPGFFRVLREQVVPVLKTYPFVRLWVAGCSTGEEVYSLSILLHEEGIAERCRIYATDLSENVLERARAGVFPLAAMQEYSRNYQLAGGRVPFSDYFTADTESVIFRRHLRDNVVFGTHNLVSDASFNEFHLILCRNVMIYFQRELQERVHALFHDSLVTFGFLGLGRSEAVRFTAYRDCYDTIDAKERVFRKIK